MSEQIMPFDGNGQPDFLSVIHAEAEKVEPTNKVPPSPPDKQLPSLVLPELLPTLSEPPKREQHLKASTFTEPTLPVDWLSQFVQNYIQTVTESYGFPQGFVVAICLINNGIAAGKKVVFTTNPYTNYPCDFVCLVGKPSRNKTGPLKEITSPLREYDKTNFAKYSEDKAAYDQNKREDRNFSGEQPIFHQRVAGDSSPESRNALLAQGNMIIIVADELMSFVDSFGRYARGGNGSGTEVSQLLSTWSNVNFTINRKSEDSKLVDDSTMGIIGGIQPGPLGKTLGTDSLMDSGFTQRFLFVYPDKAEFIKRLDRQRMTQEMRDSWNDIIGRLFGMEPLTLYLSHEVERLYTDYADANDMKADAEEDDHIGGMRQKINIRVLRLAIMSHLLSGHWNEPVITDNEMEYAIRVADYFTQIHVERIYPLLMGNARQAIKRLTKELVITEIGQTFDIQNKSALAEALNCDRAKLTNILNGKLRK